MKTRTPLHILGMNWNTDCSPVPDLTKALVVEWTQIPGPQKSRGYYNDQGEINLEYDIQ